MWPSPLARNFRKEIELINPSEIWRWAFPKRMLPFRCDSAATRLRQDHPTTVARTGQARTIRAQARAPVQITPRQSIVGSPNLST